MARMYPEDIEAYEGATEGERRVFRFLREAARPYRDFTCWYQPTLGGSGKEPDFVLFGARLGLLVLEVKDWVSAQILSYTPHLFTVRISGKVEQKTNPFRQAKGYVNALMDRLKQAPEFVSRDPAHEGGLRIPVGRMVVFPNISRSEYEDRGIRWLIPLETALLREDLDPAGEILCDTSGRKLERRISEAMPFRFRGLTGKEEEKLHLTLWPETKIELPPRQGVGKEQFRREVAALDEAQERLALRLGPGHQFIKGPPGSGKTLVLVHRCCHLRKYRGKTSAILLVCFNIALVSFLRRLIQEKGVGTGEGGVHVYHFFELCSRILGEPVDFQHPDRDYYTVVVQEALDRIAKGKSRVGPFHAVLVDEGQDFDDDMLRVLLALLNPGGDLVVSRDSYQALYGRKPGWKGLGISTAGRTHHLKSAYRNTVEIFEFTQRFIGEPPRAGRQLAILPRDLGLHGERPSLHKLASMEAVSEFVLKDIRTVVRKGEYKKSEIAIVYDDKVYGPDGFAYENRDLPEGLLGKLEALGIPACWVSQDVRAKQLYDITTDRVSLISIHSSKGLDFELVYLVGIDHIKPTEANWQGLVCLLYVAMTRAKYRLVIPYAEETNLVAHIRRCL